MCMCVHVCVCVCMCVYACVCVCMCVYIRKVDRSVVWGSKMKEIDIKSCLAFITGKKKYRK